MAQRIYRDTTNPFAIDCGDIIEIRSTRYLVKGHEREKRFGIDDPKFWVKRVVDQETGEKKLMKLSFFETFETKLGGIVIDRFRDPEKEGSMLALTRDHPSFMQGEAIRDEKGNMVRVLDIIPGKDFFVYIEDIDMEYKEYFFRMLPLILLKIVKAFEAIRFLHVNGFKHGDIRNDHIIIHSDSGAYIWIDFDYDYDGGENPFGLDIFGLGNILLYAVGKGFYYFYSIQNDEEKYGDLKHRIQPEDFSLLDKGRLMNLRKLYPIIPPSLNDILMHFSAGTSIFYESVEEIIEDLNRSIGLISQS